jgi:endonuclease YncB( thermonuclease family)
VLRRMPSLVGPPYRRASLTVVLRISSTLVDHYPFTHSALLSVGSIIGYVFLEVLAVAGASAPSAAEEITITGSARVIDGDTLGLGQNRVRLFGIDAPESAQECKDAKGVTWACGRSAKRALERLTAGQTVTCRGRDRDDYGRLLAVCSTSRGEINSALVRQGFAWAFERYSDAYVGTEAEAKAARRGVFAAANEPPWEFRAHRWEGATQRAEVDKQRRCPIKGNVSRSGERIYHLPWQATYDRVQIDERNGERWFCDEGEAERAGWRRAR